MKIKKTDLCWIELNTNNLNSNIKTYQNQLPFRNKIVAMVKSNAYGHGSKQIAQKLDRNPLIESFAVVNSFEAIKLRNNQIKKRIIVVGVINSQLADIINYNIEVTIYNLEIAKKLNKIAKKNNKLCSIHIKVDTGLSRMGISPKELSHYLLEIKKLKNLRICSVFTHLAKSYDIESSNQQENILCSLSHNLPTHVGSSKTNFSALKSNHIFTRVGIGIYGYVLHQPELSKQLKPVLSLKSRISMIKILPPKTPVGYDHTFITTKQTKIAVLPIGYAEGINPLLSNKGSVIVCDTFAPIIGKISMNYTVIDITHIPKCTENDIVTFIGKSKSKSISLYNWMEHTNLSPTHLSTNLKINIPRICV